MISFLLIPPNLLCAQANHFTQNLETAIGTNGFSKRIVFEKTIVVHDRSTKPDKINGDKIGMPDTIYPSPASSVTPPPIALSDGVAQTVQGEPMHSRISHLFPKIHAEVEAMDDQINEDKIGKLVPIYLHPPFLSEYPQVEASDIIDEVDSARKANEFTKKTSVHKDQEIMRVLVPESYSSIGKDYSAMNREISENSIKMYNENPAVVMYEGFEGLFPSTGWEILGDPTWDDDDYVAYAGYWSVWCANGGKSGIDPQYYYYQNNMDAWAIYGPFDLSDAESGSFSFRYWGKTESDYDFFSYLVSINGQNFYGYTLSGDSGGWVEKSIDLTDVPDIGNVIGQNQVWIAFNFESDSSVTDEGAFVDEVYVHKLGSLDAPNLTPYGPSGWDDKIVVSGANGTHSENTVYAGVVAYIDYAYTNNGAQDIIGRFNSELYINETLVRRSYVDGLQTGYYAYAEDFEYTFPAAGTYTLKLICDVDDEVAESNEDDNQYQRNKDILVHPNESNLTPYRPSGWDNKIVVSNVSGTHSEGTVYAGDTAHIDYAYINNGTEDIDTRFYSEFYVNESMVRRAYTNGLQSGYYAYTEDFEYTFPAAGTYTLKLVCDVENDVVESNEDDNEHKRVKQIPSQQGEPTIRIAPTSVKFTEHETVVNKPINSSRLSSFGLSKENWVPVVESMKDSPQAQPDLVVFQSNNDIFHVGLSIPGIFVANQTEDMETYKVLRLGRYNGELPPGQPNLPAVRKYINVPKGKSATIQINVGAPVTFCDYLVYPTQKPQPDFVGVEDKAFYKDKVTYNKDKWFPDKIATLGPVEIIRGRTIRLLSICPFQYNPARRVLRVFPEVDVQVNFTGHALPLDSRLSSPVFDRFIKGFTLNSNALDSSQWLQTEMLENGAAYLIITAPEFLNQANALRDWKNTKGISTVVKTTDETGKTRDEIEKYIRNAYQTWSPPPTYVLLLGDVETIPTSYRTHSIDNETKIIGTDLYYSTVDGTDYVPDVFLGRISVDTAIQAETVIQKIINYEKKPPQLLSFYSNAAVAAYFQDGTPYEGIPDGVEDRRFIRTSEEIRNFLVGKGYYVQRIYRAESTSDPTTYNNDQFGKGEPLPMELLRSSGFLWNGAAEDISSAINNGIFFILHRDHGMDRNGGYIHTGWGDPEFLESHISQLTNGNLLPVVMSFNCQTGWFDGETDQHTSRNYESFCELLLRKESGGAVGVFGASRSSYSGYNDFMAEGLFDSVWPDFLSEIPNNSGANAQIGPMLVHGKLAMDQLWGDAWSLRKVEYELFHVFGDPSLEMWTANPGGGKSFTIYNDGDNDLEIMSTTTRDNDPWLDYSPKAPFTIPPGQFRTITVSVDWDLTYPESDEERIIIESNDFDMNPYPDGVFITCTTSGGNDLAIFAADFSRTDCSGDCEGDFDGDDDVDGSDLALFAADFGSTDCFN
jgi:hypothetical protein